MIYDPDRPEHWSTWFDRVQSHLVLRQRLLCGEVVIDDLASDVSKRDRLAAQIEQDSIAAEALMLLLSDAAARKAVLRVRNKLDALSGLLLA